MFLSLNKNWTDIAISLYGGLISGFVVGLYFMAMDKAMKIENSESRRSIESEELVNSEAYNRLKNIERIVEQWDLDNVTFCAMTPEIKPGLIEYVEQEMNTTSKAYFETTLDFIKWNTAFAVAAILWFGNYLINAITNLTPFRSSLAVFTLILFVSSIAWSIGFFYYVSRYFNKHWILMSQWRESLVSSATGGPASTTVTQGLIDHYKNLPNEAERFDIALIGQWVLLSLGLGCFIVFIINLKLQV
jgi:ABC-type multidrug transport system fused ATPase/permease subunit